MKTMHPLSSSRGDFVAADWLDRLKARQLADFEQLWQLDLPLLEGANTSRGGVSTAGLMTLDNFRLIVKRQHNHSSRTWRHPFRGIPTLQKELFNIRRFDRAGLATVTPVLYAQRRDDRGTRAILVTEYLEGYQPFETFLKEGGGDDAPEREDRDALLRSVAELIARMHRAGFQHNCLYPKHVFVNRRKPRPDVRLIDLEKAGRSLRPKRRMIRDLSAFFRRSPFWCPSEQGRFLVHYCGVRQKTPEIERIWHRIQDCMARKKNVPSEPPPCDRV